MAANEVGKQPESNNPNNDKDLAACREGLKMYFDVFKHLTTLSSGSILLLVTFLSRSDKQALWRPLVAASFIGFLCSSVSAIFVMLGTARTVRRNEKTDQSPDGNVAMYGHIAKCGYWFTIISFAIGVLSLALFGLINLLQKAAT